jgi:Zn finger protein HypA/HybF involved in hydrogenase expression
MHEFSVAQEICRIAEAQVAPLPASAIVDLGLEVGEQSDLELSSLTFCLDTFLAAPPFAGATVTVTRAPGSELRVTYLEVDDERSPH